MINIAGMGVLQSSQKKQLAEQLIHFLLSNEAQQHFAKETFEYPLVSSVLVNGPQKDLSEVPAPELDLSDLDRIREAVDILKEEGIL